jgi:ACDE family multidrug resistance protein
MRKDSVLRDKNLYIIFCISILSVMGVSSITPAFPRIIEDLNISAGEVGLLITAFSLPGAVLAPFIGIMTDRLGRKRVLVPCLFIFGIAGFSCTFIQNYHLLLVLRVIQGIGGGGLVTLTTTLIGDLYSGNKVAEAMGYNASVISFGVAIYPTIGGALAMLNWHYPFLLPIVAIPLGILVLTLLQSPEPVKSLGINDYLRGTWKFLSDRQLIAFFMIGIVAVVILYGAFLTYYPLFMAEFFDLSPFAIGIIFSVGSIAMTLSSSQVGWLNKKFPLGTLLIIAFGVYIVGTVMVPFIPSVTLLVLPTLVFNLAYGTIIPSIIAAIARKAPVEYRAAIMSINTSILRLGQTIAPPLMTLAFSLGSYNWVYFGAAFLAFMAAVIVVFFIKTVQRDTAYEDNE